jgi:hypothetical protein
VKCFFRPDGFHLVDGGMNLYIDGEHFRLFAKVGVVLQDGGAHKAVWQARGDGASKFCLLCKNIFTNKSKVVNEDGTRLLRCDQITLDGLVQSTDADLRTNARYLENMSTRLGVDEFYQLQQSIGLTYAKHGILLERSLDRLLSPTEVYMHDYMHAMFVDGVLNLVIYLCFEQFIDADQKKSMHLSQLCAMRNFQAGSMVIIYPIFSQTIAAVSTEKQNTSNAKQATCCH